MLNEPNMFTAGDETTSVAAGGGELRSRGSFSSRGLASQTGDDETTPGGSCGQKKGWQRFKASRLGVLCNRKACLLGIVACIILATLGIAIPLENVDIQIVSMRCGIWMGNHLRSPEMDFFSVICLDAADMDGCRCTQQERMINVRCRNSHCISIEAICSNWIGRVWDHCFSAELLGWFGFHCRQITAIFFRLHHWRLLLFYPEQMHAREVKECELCCFWTKTVPLAYSGDDSPAMYWFFYGREKHDGTRHSSQEQTAYSYPLLKQPCYFYSLFRRDDESEGWLYYRIMYRTGMPWASCTLPLQCESSWMMNLEGQKFHHVLGCHWHKKKEVHLLSTYSYVEYFFSVTLLTPNADLVFCFWP